MSRIPWKDWLATFAVGEQRYVDCEIQSRYTKQRIIMRYKPEGMEFSASLFTAIGAYDTADIRYLICVKRVS